MKTAWLTVFVPFLALALSACEDEGLKPPARVIPAELQIKSKNGLIKLEKLEMCDAYVSKVVLGRDPRTEQPALFLLMTEAGGAWLAENTTKYVNHNMDLIADGDLVISPIIMEPIVGGEMQVSGDTGFDLERIGRALISPCKGSRARPQ